MHFSQRAEHLLLAALTTLAVALIATPACAQSSAAPKISRISAPPSVHDFLPMDPDVETAMTRYEGLVQRHPAAGQPVSERTVVFLGYDADNLYAVFLCFDREPERIRGRLVRRDLVPADDDTVAINIDTFNDGRRAYGFQVNSGGVQIDGIWSEDEGAWDLSFDAVWQTEAQRTPDGYIVLITVPFRELRFPPDRSQTWGLFLYRGIPRKSEEAYYPAFSRNIAGRLNQAARLTGIEDVEPGRPFRAIPYASYLTSRLPGPDGRLQHGIDDVEAGADLKAIIRDSIVLDATVNPDFSQVESDEPQQVVNRRFEVFFPEKRPFFIENASYFDTPLDLVFTRRITDPGRGVRLTGKLGRYSLGALLIDDHSPAGEDTATFRALRLSRDLGTQANVGAIYVERSLEDHSNAVIGLDGRWRPGTHWILGAQVARSHTGTGGNEATGTAFLASVVGTAANGSYQATFTSLTPEFRAEAGFVNRSDIMQLEQDASYRVRPRSGPLLAWGPEISVTTIWDSDGSPLEQVYQPRFVLELPRLTKLTLSATRARFQLDPDQPALLYPGSLRERTWGLGLQTSLLPRTSLSLEYTTGRTVNFEPAPEQAPYEASFDQAAATLGVHPTDSLTWRTTGLYTRVGNQYEGTAFEHLQARSKVAYQFTPALSLRLILTYTDLEVDPSATSLDAGRRLNTDLLLAYRIHPGTALFAGLNTNASSRDMPLQGRSRTTSLATDHRQLFVKISYLLH